MTPEYAAEQLLALGPLSHDEFRRITGWNDGKIRGTIARLKRAGTITVTSNGNRIGYWLSGQLPRDRYEPGAFGRMRLTDARWPRQHSMLA